MMNRNFLNVLALGSLTMLGCDREPPLLEVYSLPEELGDIDVSYLPLEYADTGHAYHMPLLAMELTVHGIPNVPVELEDCNGDDGLKAPNGDGWLYHHAVGVAPEGALKIVDPVVSDQLLDPAAFKRAFGDGPSRLVSGALDSGLSSCEDVALAEVPARVEDMEPFNFSNVLIHCAYMRRFYRDIGGDYEAREQKLIERVYELSMDLKDMGLLEYEEKEFALLANGPYCPDPIPSK